MRLQWESREARSDRLGKWHDWFAWYPVRVGEGDVRWLETVQRAGAYERVWWDGCYQTWWTWEHRLPPAALQSYDPAKAVREHPL